MVTGKDPWLVRWWDRTLEMPLLLGAALWGLTSALIVGVPIIALWAGGHLLGWW